MTFVLPSILSYSFDPEVNSLLILDGWCTTLKPRGFKYLAVFLMLWYMIERSSGQAECSSCRSTVRSTNEVFQEIHWGRLFWEDTTFDFLAPLIWKCVLGLLNRVWMRIISCDSPGDCCGRLMYNLQVFGFDTAASRVYRWQFIVLKIPEQSSFYPSQ